MRGVLPGLRYACGMGMLLIDVTDGAAWLMRDGIAMPWRTGQTLPADARVVAVGPGEAVALHRVELPARRASELRQAIPFALEDRLAQPVEQLHFAPGVRAGQTTEVAVVGRDVMQRWVDAIGSSGWVADRLVVDAQLLPDVPGRIHAARVGDRVLVRTDAIATAMPAADWPAWRRLFPAVPVHGLGSHGRFVEIDGDALDALDRPTVFRHVAGQLNQAIDLLQGDFAPRHRQAGQRRLWRWAAILAVVAVTLALIEAATGVLIERQRREALREQMAQVFRTALPDARMTADPAAQLAAEVARQRRAGGAGGVLGVLARVAPVLTQGSRYRLESLDYRLGALELEVAAADVASLDALRESLAAEGLSVEVTGIDAGEGGVRGRLRFGAVA